MDNQLRAALVDAAHVANWQRSGDKKIKQPKRIARPGVNEGGTRIGGADKVRTREEVEEILASVATPEEVIDGS